MLKTDYDYMSEPGRAERVVQGFTEVTLHVLRTQQSDRRYRGLADAFSASIIEMERLDESAKYMKYTDIVCLVENMAGNETYRGERNGELYTGDESQLFYYKCMQDLLLGASICCIPIRLFLNLPVRTFYKCLWNMSDRDILLEEYQSLKMLYTELGGKGDAGRITIEAVLKHCGTIYNAPWRITGKSLKSYSTDMLNAHKLTGKLLVKSFKEAFPERFCVEEVRSKYLGGIPVVPDEVPGDFLEEEVPFN